MKWVLMFFFGAMWGSFFFTLAVRYINGSFHDNRIKALFSASRCPNCQQKIAPIYLIPIIGYLVLKGRCNKCSSKINLSYPAFEVVYGVLFILIVSKIGMNAYSFTIFLITGLAISISIIDTKILIIPDSLVIVFVALSIYPIVLNYSFKDNLFGLIMMFLFFSVILLIFPGSFGGGDLKFASSIGLLLGVELSIVTLEVALISGSIIGTIYALIIKKGLRIKIPFAPFLAFGVITAFLYGRDIALVYYNIVY
ncbi:MAG: prepilin peptidase [Spirochaetota bacterium]|nr:prepilin peptidase [Spirochaetota bacterium]